MQQLRQAAPGLQIGEDVSAGITILGGHLVSQIEGGRGGRSRGVPGGSNFYFANPSIGFGTSMLDSIALGMLF